MEENPGQQGGEPDDERFETNDRADSVKRRAILKLAAVGGGLGGLPSSVSASGSSRRKPDPWRGDDLVQLGDFETGRDGWRTWWGNDLSRVTKDEVPVGVVRGEHALAVEVEDRGFPVITNVRRTVRADFLNNPHLGTHVVAVVEETDADLVFRFRLYHHAGWKRGRRSHSHGRGATTGATNETGNETVERGAPGRKDERGGHWFGDRDDRTDGMWIDRSDDETGGPRFPDPRNETDDHDFLDWRDEHVEESEPIVVPQLQPRRIQWDMSGLGDDVLESAVRLDVVWYPEDQEPERDRPWRWKRDAEFRGLVVFDDVRLTETAPVIDARKSQQKKMDLHRAHGMIVDRVFEEQTETLERGTIEFVDGTEVPNAFEVLDDGRYRYVFDGETFVIGNRSG